MALFSGCLWLCCFHNFITSATYNWNEYQQCKLYIRLFTTDTQMALINDLSNGFLSWRNCLLHTFTFAFFLIPSFMYMAFSTISFNCHIKLYTINFTQHQRSNWFEWNLEYENALAYTNKNLILNMGGIFHLQNYKLSTFWPLTICCNCLYVRYINIGVFGCICYRCWRWLFVS